MEITLFLDDNKSKLYHIQEQKMMKRIFLLFSKSSFSKKKLGHGQQRQLAHSGCTKIPCLFIEEKKNYNFDFLYENDRNKEFLYKDYK